MSYYGRKRARDYYNNEPFFDNEKGIEGNAIFFKSLYEQCPICGVRNSIITNAHCTIEHGMTKKEVESIYGKILTGREIEQKLIKEAKQKKEGATQK